MPLFNVKAPDGSVIPVNAPDGATEQQAIEFAAKTWKPAESTSIGDKISSGIQAATDSVTNLGVGAIRGAKDVIDTGAHWLASGFDKVAGTKEGERVQAMNDAGNKEFDAKYGDSTSAKVGRLTGQIAATAPVGGLIAAPVKMLANAGVATKVLAPVADAIATSGMRANGAEGLAKNLAIRSAGGAVTGAASTGLVDPNSAGAGAVVGAALPGTLKLANEGGKVAASLVRPFFKAGQETAASGVLKQFATDPAAAATALKNTQPVIDGSAPTAVQASGDIGLANLSRTLQNASTEYGANLSTRQAVQNAARTDALDTIAGNPGKIAVAKDARDKVTDPMRESVLDRAGDIPATPLVRKVDRMLADPNNAGNTAQQALKNIKTQLAGMTAEDGTVNARALYEMRKDINLAMEGKLSGDAGNLKFAKGQLATVKGHIDDAIDLASRKIVAPSKGATPGTSLTVPGSAVATQGQTSFIPRGQELVVPGTNVGPYNPTTLAEPVPSWKDYLKTYSDLSKPINQMDKLSDVMKRIQNGTVDQHGNLVLSAAKLNNILKNEGEELGKHLTIQQMDVLRRLAADLNSSQLAATTGKALGSNTMQNLAQNQILEKTLGKAGLSTPATSAIGQLLKIPYGTANAQIQSRIGQALLDPKETARLLELAPKPKAASGPALRLLYRSAPVLGANQGR